MFNPLFLLISNNVVLLCHLVDEAVFASSLSLYSGSFSFFFFFSSSLFGWGVTGCMMGYIPTPVNLQRESAREINEPEDSESQILWFVFSPRTI